MRSVAGLVVLAVMAMAAGCGTTQRGIAMPQTDVDAVNQVIEAQRAAFNARNLDGLPLGIADDAKVISLPAFGTGKDAQVTKVRYREDMAALMVRGDRTLVEHSRWNVVFHDPPHATATGEVDLGGRKADFQYKLEKRGGRWLIVESTAKRK